LESSSKKDSIHKLDMVESVDLFIHIWVKGQRGGGTNIKKYIIIKVGGQVQKKARSPRE
jgi:hypothetical protein